MIWTVITLIAIGLFAGMLWLIRHPVMIGSVHTPVKPFIYQDGVIDLMRGRGYVLVEQIDEEYMTMRENGTDLVLVACIDRDMVGEEEIDMVNHMCKMCHCDSAYIVTNRFVKYSAYDYAAVCRIGIIDFKY